MANLGRQGPRHKAVVHQVLPCCFDHDAASTSLAFESEIGPRHGTVVGSPRSSPEHHPIHSARWYKGV